MDRMAARPNTRRADSPQSQLTVACAFDIGWTRSKSPHCGHRYAYVGMLTPALLVKTIATQSVIPRMSSGTPTVDELSHVRR
ncbi:MAG: hypothetical protein QOH57_2484 [Mycobacterium sp.]|jgi:hypothetical protein|nr:hypothetical protein [Mycobacterium sp.]